MARNTAANEEAVGCWLLLEKSEETRVSKGIDPYEDRSGELYSYDSLVPNFRNVKSGDVALLRKEDAILGIGRIGGIVEGDSKKKHRRCPSCNFTDIRERKTKIPKWKCGRCKQEFAEPRQTWTDVKIYTAEIVDFSRLDFAPSVRSVKACATGKNGIKSQLSILALDAGRLNAVLEDFELPTLGNNNTKSASGQGFGLSFEERKAVELKAMHIVSLIYQEKGWAVLDKSQTCPYDLLAVREGQTRYIEVKGTTGGGESVLLTHGEISHAREHPQHSALVIVANIVLKRDKNGFAVSGGKVVHHKDPWIIEESQLTATQFRYEVQAA